MIMKNHKKLRNVKYWQNCPVCGDAKRFYFKDSTRHWKPYSVVRGYCGFRSAQALTKRSARKKWNKATNVVIVTEAKGVKKNA